MRTTLTLDEDVAATIEWLRKIRRVSLRDIVNEALREGLRHMMQSKRERAPFRTEAVDLGKCLVENIDNVTEVLAIAECKSAK